MPRPAPRRKVKVRAWAVVDQRTGAFLLTTNDRETAKQSEGGEWIVVKLTGEYTPKSKGAKR